MLLSKIKLLLQFVIPSPMEIAVHVLYLTRVYL